MKFSLLLFVGALAQLTISCAAAPQNFREPPAVKPSGSEPASGAMYSHVDESYALRSGDKISFFIEEDRKPPSELTVMASGEVDVPNVGRFPVAGKTCRVVGAQLKAELEKKYYKKATVTVALNQAAAMTLQGTSNVRVYFNGAVLSPGAREFAPDGKITVSRAVLISGGFKDFANKSKVQLIRKRPDGKSDITIVNVDALLRGKPGNDPVLQPEDMIYVPEKLINF